MYYIRQFLAGNEFLAALSRNTPNLMVRVVIVVIVGYPVVRVRIVTVLRIAVIDQQRPDYFFVAVTYILDFDLSRNEIKNSIFILIDTTQFSLISP